MTDRPKQWIPQRQRYIVASDKYSHTAVQ